jgi:hypothetical protein
LGAWTSKLKLTEHKFELSSTVGAASCSHGHGGRCVTRHDEKTSAAGSTICWNTLRSKPWAFFKSPPSVHSRGTVAVAVAGISLSMPRQNDRAAPPMAGRISGVYATLARRRRAVRLPLHLFSRPRLHLHVSLHLSTRYKR